MNPVRIKTVTTMTRIIILENNTSILNFTFNVIRIFKTQGGLNISVLYFSLNEFYFFLLTLVSMSHFFVTRLPKGVVTTPSIDFRCKTSDSYDFSTRG